MKYYEEGNNALRPWTSGVTEHDYGVATIILYRTPEPSEIEAEEAAQRARITGLRRDTTGLSESVVSDALTINPYESLDYISDAIPIDSLKDKRIARLALSDNDEKNFIGVFNNFSLNNVQEASQDAIKLHVNFSEHWNLFFFGQQPKIYAFSGVFLDSREYPYYQEFMVAYEKYLRGRKSVENKMEFVISYQGKILTGYLISVGVTSTAETSYIKHFNFNVIVKDEIWVRNNYKIKMGSSGQLIYENISQTNYLNNEYRFKNPAFGIAQENLQTHMSARAGSMNQAALNAVAARNSSAAALAASNASFARQSAIASAQAKSEQQQRSAAASAAASRSASSARTGRPDNWPA